MLIADILKILSLTGRRTEQNSAKSRRGPAARLWRRNWPREGHTFVAKVWSRTVNDKPHD